MTDDIPCVELVELLTDYLEGALDDELRQRIDNHLSLCDGCGAALAQFRAVIDTSGQLTEADVTDVDPYVRDRLLSTLRRPRRR